MTTGTSSAASETPPRANHHGPPDAWGNDRMVLASRRSLSQDSAGASAPSPGGTFGPGRWPTISEGEGDPRGTMVEHQSNAGRRVNKVGGVPVEGLSGPVVTKSSRWNGARGT